MPVFGKILSSWMRMGSYSRLFIPISLLIISISAVRYQALLNQETALATSHYQSEARQLDLYLANTVLPLAVQTDLRSVPRVLRSALPLNHNLSSIRWDNAGEHTEVLAETSPKEQLAASVPSWFVHLAGITAINSRLTVALPGGQDGILDVYYRPELPLLQVWNRVRHQAMISAINITLIFVLLGLILASHRKLLARLTMATERFRSGDFTIRMADGATPKEQAVSRSFNSMAGNIGTCCLRCRPARNGWA